MKILCVDDDTIVRNLYNHGLGNIFKDDSIVLAASGEEALGLLNSERFDLVITDLKMPGLSGLDVLKHVKKHMPGIEVIIVTGMASIKTAVDAIRLGARDYIEKPISFDLLVEKVNNIRDYNTRLVEAEEFRLAKEACEVESGKELHMLEMKNQQLKKMIEQASLRLKSSQQLSNEEIQEVVNMLDAALT